MEVVPKTVEYYYMRDGKCPYKLWFAALQDIQAQQAIDARLARARRGLLGDYGWVGQGVWEFRIDIGPGYRVYFGQPNPAMIVLLDGGHKKTQGKDIQTTQAYWADFQRKQR